MKTTKGTILSIGYGDNFLLDDDFDLNEIRSLTPVKESGGVFVPDDDCKIELHFNKEYKVDHEDAMAVELAATIEDRDRWYKWFTEGGKKQEELKKEIDGLKIQLAEMTTGPCAYPEKPF